MIMRTSRVLIAFSLGLTLLVSGLVTAPAQAATYNVDKNHSEVGFKVRHLVSKVPGRFNTFEGTIEFDPANLAASSVDVKIDAGSIDTGNDKRDGHLRSADFFDVETYPSITFQGSKFVKTSDGYSVTGTLTLHGVAKEVTLPFTFGGELGDPWGNTRAGFEASVTLDRKDYGIVWNKALDQGGVMLGDDVAVEIELSVVKQKPEDLAAETAEEAAKE
jgi:polyisoprenoid-binding protein YceI